MLNTHTHIYIYIHMYTQKQEQYFPQEPEPVEVKPCLARKCRVLCVDNKVGFQLGVDLL